MNFPMVTSCWISWLKTSCFFINVVVSEIDMRTDWTDDKWHGKMFLSLAVA